MPRVALRKAITTRDSITGQDCYELLGRLIAAERIQLFVDQLEESETGCLIWTGAQNQNKYGNFNLIDTEGWSKSIRTHRLAYLLFVGDIGDLHVMHSCDIPPCCEPTHLSLGTHQDNMKDKAQKGRAYSTRYLSEEQMERIMVLRREGLYAREISEQMDNLPLQTIYNIIKERGGT